MRIISIKLLTLLVFLVSSNMLKSQCDFDVLIDMSPQVQDNIYCPNDSVTLATGEFDSYQWFYNFSNSNTGGTQVSGGNNQSLTFAAGEWAVVYFYVEGTKDGCTEASATVVWDSWVFAGVAISHDPQSEYCEGDSALIENAFQGPTIFQWFRDGIEIPGATEASYWVKGPGTYTLSAAWPMCPTYFLSSGIGPTFTFIGTIQPEITLNGDSLISNYGNSFQWYLEGVEIEGATNESFGPVIQGNYTVEITDDNGCYVSSEPYFFMISSLSSISKEPPFYLYPNPADNSFSVKNVLNIPYEIEVSDLQGRTIFRDKSVRNSSQVVDSDEWGSGLYFCKIKASNKAYHLKLIIQ